MINNETKFKLSLSGCNTVKEPAEDSDNSCKDLCLHMYPTCMFFFAAHKGGAPFPIIILYITDRKLQFFLAVILTRSPYFACNVATRCHGTQFKENCYRYCFIAPAFTLVPERFACTGP